MTATSSRTGARSPVSSVRVLVTGADGFVARHLRRHLEAEGDEVVGVDRDCDVTDARSVRDVFERVRPEVTYHLAALTNVAESWDHAEEYTRVNVVGTQRVLDAAAEFAPDSTTLFVSTSEVYGVTALEDQPLDEECRIAPVSPYAASKVEGERVVFDAVRARGQRALVARPFNHLGSGQGDTFVVPALITRLLVARQRADESIAVGDLSARRDFTDVRDVVRAYRLLSREGVVGEVYHVASGRDVAIADIAAQLVDAVAPGTRLVVDPALLRPVEVPVSRGSYDKLRRATGWSPTYTLSESLAAVVADVLERHQG